MLSVNYFGYLLAVLVFCISAYLPLLHNKKSKLWIFALSVIHPLFLSLIYSLAVTHGRIDYLGLVFAFTAMGFEGISLGALLLGIFTAFIVHIYRTS